MKLSRVRTPDGVVTGECVDDTLTAENGERYRIGEDASLLPPCEPTTVYCAGRNYQDYLEHKGNERPEQPHFFLKPPVSPWPSGEPIPYPAFADGVGYAGELAAVIDTKCKEIEPDDVSDHVRGYTIMNDVDALGEPGAAMKVFDAAAPLGPWIETDVDPRGLELETTVGGEVRQEGNTSEMLFDPADIVAFLSKRVTLQAGDVVAFGSPANPGEVAPGERVEIWYEDVGTLTNELGRPE
jgi:2-keto-4-pentenoate hydratase/2-oxohepta-3-ene-1,7-dioic acid hydratase in catechol pathway